MPNPNLEQGIPDVVAGGATTSHEIAPVLKPHTPTPIADGAKSLPRQSVMTRSLAEDALRGYLEQPGSAGGFVDWSGFIEYLIPWKDPKDAAVIHVSLGQIFADGHGGLLSTVPYAGAKVDILGASREEGWLCYAVTGLVSQPPVDQYVNATYVLFVSPSDTGWDSQLDGFEFQPDTGIELGGIPSGARADFRATVPNPFAGPW